MQTISDIGSPAPAAAQGRDAPAPARGAGGLLRLAGAGLRAHAPFLVLLAVHLAGIALLRLAYPALPPLEIAASVPVFLVFLACAVLITLVCWRFVHLMVNVRPAHPLPALAHDVWSYLRDPGRATNGLIAMALLLVYVQLFAYVKIAIPQIQPFAWDASLMAWDRWLHFGHDPWRLLQPVFGTPAATFALNVAYNLWFMVVWVFLVGFAFARRPSLLRTQFLVAFMLSWTLGGNVMAVFLSSAGPCYYALLGLSPDPYAPLMTYLAQANEAWPVWALGTQDMLWAGYTGEGMPIGISAMPSMHNAATCLIAIAAWRVDRRLGIAMAAFAGLILLASVHLAWHYAIDSYAGLAIAFGCWQLGGLIARRWENGRWARDFAQKLDVTGTPERSAG